MQLKPNNNKGADQFSVYQTSPAGLNPRDIDITDKLINNRPWYDAGAEAILLKTGSKLTAAFFNSGIIIVATVRQSFRGDGTFFVDAILKVPRNAGLQVAGLFGDLDGDASNDLRKRDGTILTVGSRSDELRRIYQTECKFIFPPRNKAWVLKFLFVCCTCTCIQGLLLMKRTCFCQ